MFNGCVEYIKYFLALPSSKRALTALARSLLERGAIPGDQVHAIVAAETVKDESENGKASDDDATRLPG